MALKKMIDADKYYLCNINSVRYVPDGAVIVEIDMRVRSLSDETYNNLENTFVYNIHSGPPEDSDITPEYLQAINMTEEEYLEEQNNKQYAYELFKKETLQEHNVDLVTQAEIWINNKVELFKEFIIV